MMTIEQINATQKHLDLLYNDLKGKGTHIPEEIKGHFHGIYNWLSDQKAQVLGDQLKKK